MIFWAPRKSCLLFLILQVRIKVMPLGHPCAGRASYIHIKLQTVTHTLWVEMKNSLSLKSNNALASYLLSTIAATNANEVNCSRHSHSCITESIKPITLLVLTGISTHAAAT